MVFFFNGVDNKRKDAAKIAEKNCEKKSQLILTEIEEKIAYHTLPVG